MVYFISGHRNLKKEDFEKYYVTRLKEIIENDKNFSFVVGDYEGVDQEAQKWLSEILKPEDKGRVTIYHMFEKPRHCEDEAFRKHGGFQTDVDRDSEMTRVSNFDVAWIYKTRWTSGTAQNILRRFEIGEGE